MATPGEKLAESLLKLKKLQDKGIVGIKAEDFSRIHRERLLKNGFLREVMRGWYISAPHTEQFGESTSWYTSFWGFCSRYLNDRYGKDYCVSAEQSLLIHAGSQTIPHQLIIRSTNGNNTNTQLLFQTSLFVMKSTLPKLVDIEVEKNLGIRVVKLIPSIIHCPISMYQTHSTDVKTALLLVSDASELLSELLEGGNSTIAGRLAGAYRNLGQEAIANDIMKTMKIAGYDVREEDPFKEKTTITLDYREKSPYVNRIRLMWENMRTSVIEVFPKEPKINLQIDEYISKMEEIFLMDAYHSLSIERYVVTPDLIERVRKGDWNTQENEADREQKHAMAARGYFLAFNSLKNSVVRVYEGDNSGNVAKEDHSDWYRQLFAPSVQIGLLKPSDLAGYRTNQVYIGQSKHTPLSKEGVRDAMPILFEMLKNEEHAGVRAVLGHYIFVYIHPYMDGNGRVGRFLMNLMLASGGYPWTVIPVTERDQYMNALEKASVDQDIVPFAKFIAWLVDESIKGTPIAKLS